MAIKELAIIAEINTRPDNQIRVVLNDTGNGNLAIDVRRWYVGDDEEWHPTGKGISIPFKHADEVYAAIGEAMVHPDFAAKVEEAAIAAGKAKAAAKKAPAKKVAARKTAARRTR